MKHDDNAVYEQNIIEKWTERFPSTRNVTSESLRRLTAIAAKVYNALLLNRIKPEIGEILKHQTSFQRNQSTSL